MSAPAAVLPGESKVKLKVTQGVRKGKTYSLKQGVNYVGRKGPHEITIDLTEQENPGKEVKVNRFALIWFDKNGPGIADTGRGVTRVNGTLIPSGKRFPIKDGDTIKFGKTALEIKVTKKVRTGLK